MEVFYYYVLVNPVNFIHGNDAVCILFQSNRQIEFHTAALSSTAGSTRYAYCIRQLHPSGHNDLLGNVYRGPWRQNTEKTKNIPLADIIAAELS